MSETRYTCGGPDGWLRVRREETGGIVPLPEYLQVRLLKSRNGREHFTPVEGRYAGQRLSVKAGYLHAARPEYRGPAHLRFHPGLEIVQYPGGEIHAITHGEQPIPFGAHHICLPDVPHDMGRHYLGQSGYAMNWFCLCHCTAAQEPGDHHLHSGQVSPGCVAVTPVAWTNLYRYLILSRSGDGKTVGTINVVR